MDQHSPQKWFNLEEQFFKSLDNQLLEKIREQTDLVETAEEIMKLTGITSKEVATKIAALRISPQTLAAFCLVPLVAVAWASDDVDADERQVIEQAATAAGLDERCLKLLSGWLNRRPASELFDTWCEYAKVLVSSMDESHRVSLRDHIVGQSTAVAKASGGILGIGAISASEKAVLERIKTALG